MKCKNRTNHKKSFDYLNWWRVLALFGIATIICLIMVAVNVSDFQKTQKPIEYFDVEVWLCYDPAGLDDEEDDSNFSLKNYTDLVELVNRVSRRNFRTRVHLLATGVGPYALDWQDCQSNAQTRKYFLSFVDPLEQQIFVYDESADPWIAETITIITTGMTSARAVTVFRREAYIQPNATAVLVLFKKLLLIEGYLVNLKNTKKI